MLVLTSEYGSRDKRAPFCHVYYVNMMGISLNQKKEYILMIMSTAELTHEEIDRLLAEKIPALPQEKKVLLLEWMKKELSELHIKEKENES